METNVFDVAQYIVNKIGQISTVKLQKLVYYCQAWSLAWDDEPLFEEEFEAWASGPVAPKLYEKHRGSYKSPTQIQGANVSHLSENQIETIDVVLKAYGGKSPDWLVTSTHMEDPWKEARGDLADGQRGHNVISKESMLAYYSSLK